MRTLIPILLLLLVKVVQSQNYTFGKVSKDELEETKYEKDTSAAAAYLYKHRKTYFKYFDDEGFQLVTEIHNRIKFYKKEGFKYGTHVIRLAQTLNGTRETLSNIKGITYNIEGDKIQEVKLGKSSIFRTEASKYTNEVKFTMPDLKEGTVIEYKYKIYSPFYVSVDDYMFQQNIPVKNIMAVFEAPEYFNFNLRTKGFYTITPKKEDRNRNFKVEGNQIDYSSTAYTFNATDVPALKDEPYVNNINNYRASAIFELSYVDLPNAPIKYYSTTWEDVVKDIYGDTRFGDQLHKTGYFEENIDKLIATISSPKARMETIFKHVKAKMKWNEVYGCYTSKKGVKKAYASGIGNVSEINLMLTAMLRHAGVKAYPVLVSTRARGIPLFPTRKGFNYVITYAQYGDEVVLLDATSKYNTPNVISYRALNWKGRIITEHGTSQLIDLYPRRLSKSTKSMYAKLDENGDVEGSMRTIKTGHQAKRYRQSYGAKKDNYVEKLQEDYEDFEVTDFSVANHKTLEKPVMESYKFSILEQADVISGKMYFSPLLFLKEKENPFKLEKREFPIDFGYPFEDVYRCNIAIPEGFKVDAMPKSKMLQLPDGLGSFKYQIKANNGMIQLIADFKINAAVVPPAYYDALKSFFRDLIDTESEQVVLSKI